MTIKKFTGQTKEEAIDEARNELGSNVVIMNVKEVRPGGFFGFFKKSSYEVTAAVEEENVVYKKPDNQGRPHFDATVSDESVVSKNDTPVLKSIADETNKETDISLKNSGQTVDGIDTASLKDAFHAVNEVVQNNYIKKEKVKRKSPGSEIYREEDIRKKTKAFTAPDIESPVKNKGANRQFSKIVYNTLLNNGVAEADVNQILKDMERVLENGNSLDYILSGIYQKIILMLGKPHPIILSDKKPCVVFFIGPTGVGKTTTIAKIASSFKLSKNKNVALFTTDTYRIAAAEQLRTYASILSVPFEVIMEDENINDYIQKYEDKDLILVDTAGFSHKNDSQRDAMKNLLGAVDGEYTKEVYLVLSATTRFSDMRAIIDSYREYTDFCLLFTKIDETDIYGPILSARLYADKDLSYVGSGQNVPDDISIVDIQKMARLLLGGH